MVVKESFDELETHMILFMVGARVNNIMISE